MKNYLTLLSLFTSPLLAAHTCSCQQKNYSFYIKVGSGISFSQSAGVFAPSPPWNTAIQGYDAKLGN